MDIVKKRSNLFVIMTSLTLLASVGFLAEWKLNKKEIWDEIYSSLPLDPKSAAAYIKPQIEGLSDVELSNLARSIVEDRDIEFSRTITNEFIYNAKDKESKRLAVLIAEQGFVIKNDIILANRAALEYKLGRFIQKNQEKAVTLLTSPVLVNVPISKFYLAEIMLDKDNPKRDPEAAKQLLIESANAGIVAAKDKLKEMM